VIAPEAELADDVYIGPFVVIEGRVRIGPGCVIRPYVHLCGPLTLGSDNHVFSGAILGERPQHTKYRDEPTGVEIGDGNIIREHVTVHRGTTQSWTTRIGHRNFLMANCHIAHDCCIGNDCIIANGALLAGHVTIDDNAYLSGNCAVHQFVRIGRLALLSGCSTTVKDIPPFLMQQGINFLMGVNVVGMRRAGMSGQQIDGVREAYRQLFHEGQPMTTGMARLEHQLGHIDAVAELIQFIRTSKRGVSATRDRPREVAA
jgi:UDP-N-acetylglucosamine acyltransferase